MVFISNFNKNKVIGVEPCKNLAKITRRKGYKTFVEYWNINCKKNYKKDVDIIIRQIP